MHTDVLHQSAVGQIEHEVVKKVVQESFGVFLAPAETSGFRSRASPGLRGLLDEKFVDVRRAPDLQQLWPCKAAALGERDRSETINASISKAGHRRSAVAGRRCRELGPRERRFNKIRHVQENIHIENYGMEVGLSSSGSHCHVAGAPD